MRLIDADKLIQDILDLRNCYNGFSDTYDKACIIGVIDEQPTVKPERKKGKWVAKDLDNFRKYEVVCSECGSRYIGNYDAYDEPCDFNFCPNCGADMRGGEENEDE